MSPELRASGDAGAALGRGDRQDDAGRGLGRDPAFVRLLADSHRRLVGRPLGDPPPSVDYAGWLYEAASFCLLAHDTRPDPVFIYANEAAQRRFGYRWDEFITLPSRLSAEAPDRDARQRLLEAVRRDGFIADYHGLRIAKSGQRFVIEAATVWELRDPAGTRLGQAAAFSRWRDADRDRS